MLIFVVFTFAEVGSDYVEQFLVREKHLLPEGLNSRPLVPRCGSHAIFPHAPKVLHLTLDLTYQLMNEV